MQTTLKSTICDVFSRHAADSAVEIAGNPNVNYGSLGKYASEIVSLLPPADAASVTAIYCDKTIVPLAAVVGCLMSERPWIALSPIMPHRRLLRIMEEIPVRELILSSSAFDENRKLLQDDGIKCGVLSFDPVTCRGRYEMPPKASFMVDRRLPLPPDLCCFYMSSGSTGVPKYIPLSHSNILSFVRNLHARYTTGPGNCLTLLHEMTSSASLQNLLLAFTTGASLCVPPDRNFLTLERFFIEARPDFVHIVPSTIRLLDRFARLQENAFPFVRTTLIGGEVVRDSIVGAWKRAAPQTVIDNSYGPTEATVNIAFHRCVEGDSIPVWKDGIAPIGRPFADHRFLLLNDDLMPSTSGELFLSGPQIALGYYKNDQETIQKFITLPHIDRGASIWYKSGDRACIDESTGNYVVVGRVDREFKISGYRVDPHEIECTLRRLNPSIKEIAAIPVGTATGEVEKIICFIEGESGSSNELLAQCRSVLPYYMVPYKICMLDQMPLNVSGKIDFPILREEARRI